MLVIMLCLAHSGVRPRGLARDYARDYTLPGPLWLAHSGVLLVIMLVIILCLAHSVAGFHTRVLYQGSVEGSAPGFSSRVFIPGFRTRV